ncbi:MAG: alternate-type signal peptide domain-containing protein [Actinomycetia bacterium]|nr:alternate-type signal peptide domain-containing protein [Actinomycetes bacterium]
MNTNRRAVKALAAGALGALVLTGIGGSFANWYDSETIGTGELTAGHLDMTVDSANASWTDVNKGTAINPANFTMVPGDVVEYRVSITPDLVGDNLEAELVAELADTTGDLAAFVEIDTDLGGAQTMLITPDTAEPVEAVVKISMPWGADTVTYTDGGEDLSVDLGSLTISLTQTQNP